MRPEANSVDTDEKEDKFGAQNDIIEKSRAF